MSEQWGEIDGGWEDVDLEEKKKRTRARGKQKRRTTAAQPVKASTPSKKRRPHRPTGATEAKPKVSAAPPRPWLLPLVGFVAAIIIFGLVLMATS